MSFDLNQFRGKVIQPARPTLFKCGIDLVFVNTALDKETLEFTCEATSIPQLKVGKYPIYYQGRQTQFAGDRVFDDWGVTIMMLEDNNQHQRFVDWHDAASDWDSGVRTFGNANEYKGVGSIQQMTPQGEVFTEWQVGGIWPHTIGPVELAWRNTDRYITFDVTFAVDWIRPV